MRTMLLACVLSLWPVAPGSAGPGEDGARAFKRGDYAMALWLWRPLAKEGDTTAQYLIGHMYDRGLGVPQDDVMAVEWYRKAAEQGDASAWVNVVDFAGLDQCVNGGGTFAAIILAVLSFL